MENLQNLFHSLANKNRLDILRVLAQTNPKCMTFSQLRKILELNPNTLSYNLGVLLKAGLVEHKLKKTHYGYSCYKITELGKVYLAKPIKKEV